LRECTICQPSLILDKIEGEKQSPEKSNKDFGFYYLSYSTLALKLTIPPKPCFD
jgi:hypothetical protein